jgi:hypothetical protein
MNLIWVGKFNNILTKRRLSYAWIAGGALWAAWLLSVFSGSNGFDLAGQVIGTDYIQFYAAGRTLMKGNSAYLYDFAYQSSLEREIIGPGLSSFHAFITPPLFASIFVPLSMLPYSISFVIWSVLGLIFLGISVVLLTHQDIRKTFTWALIWFPVFASISFGQNSLLSLAILSIVFLCWKEEKYFLSGLITGLLFYKPQLIIGLLVLYILDHRIERKAITGFVVAIVVIIFLNIFLFPEASSAYLNFVTHELPSLISRDQFPIWHMHTIRGFWILLLGDYNTVADILYVLSIGVITVGFIKYYQHYQLDRILIFSAAICLTMLITPHAMIYDWSLLLIPAILLWRNSEHSKPLLKFIFAIMWIGAFISGPLSYLQLQYLQVAFQMSIPLFIFSSHYLYKYYLNQPSKQVQYP